MTETGQLPQSAALAEASPDSISEFLSRSPTSLTPADRARMVGILREQRARWEAAEAAGGHTRTKRAPGASAASLVSTKKVGELDL